MDTPGSHFLAGCSTQQPFSLAQLSRGLKPKIKVPAGSRSFQRPQGREPPWFFRSLAASGVPRLVVARLEPLPLPSTAFSPWVPAWCLWAQMSHEDTSHGTYLIQYDLVLA